VWVDPDDPEALTSRHPLWSHRHPAPVRFRSRDYGDGTGRDLGSRARDELAAVVGARPDGELRMLTQPRRWGWLFNPITIFVAWHDDPDRPVGILLEVTNTPWKERHRYAARLSPTETPEGVHYVARIPKLLHVSPFLDEDYVYDVTIGDGDGDGDGDADGSLRVGIDVTRPGAAEAVLTTGMRLGRAPASRRVLGRALWSAPLSTQRVSIAIHRQALRLWRKGVAFVPHPRKRARAT
jgi:hypothetical protein